MLKDFVQFLDQSPTAWHAAKQVAHALQEAGFTPLQEGERWSLKPGNGYFVLRDEAALCAFRTPKNEWSSSALLATHLDSPSFKLKPIPEHSQKRMTSLFTEPYGSPLLHTWLDRDLCLSGRVIARNRRGTRESHLVFLDHHPLSIPSLPTHLDRSVSEKGLFLNKQDHLQPIATLAGAYAVEELLRQELSSAEILSWDLFLVPLEKARFLGAKKELVSSYRLDNLSSAYAALYALVESAPTKSSLQLAIFWDHEEVGSCTALGADSFFVNQVLDRIRIHHQLDREELYQIKSRSLCLSLDAAHGFNPNYSDRFDPCNSPHLGGGVVLKTSAMQKYATSASSSAPLVALAQKAKVSLQRYAGRSDIPGGSTVGPTMAAHLGMLTADAGVAAWAMHSIRETISAEDEIALCAFSKAFLEEEEFFAYGSL